MAQSSAVPVDTLSNVASGSDGNDPYGHNEHFNPSQPPPVDSDACLLEDHHALPSSSSGIPPGDVKDLWL